MYKIIFTFTFICTVFMTTAQNNTDQIQIDPISAVSTSFNYYSKTKFVAEGNEYEVTNSEWKNAFIYGGNIYRKKIYLLGGLEYHRFSHQRHFDTDKDINEQYRSYIFNTGAVFILPKKWRIVPYYTGRFASDYDNKDNDEYFYAASVLFEKKHNKHFKYGFGAYYRTGFEAGTWLPIVKLVYQHNNWVANILVPSWVGLHYDFNKNTRIGARATFNSSIFNTDSYDISNTLSFTTTTIGAQFRQRILGDLFLFAETGTTYKPQAEFINTTTNNFVGPVGDNHLYFSIGLHLLKF